MKIKDIIIGALILILLALGFLVFKPKEIGSVVRGGEMKYTQLSGSVATSSTQIKTSAGTLGSIIITEDSALAIDVYDATSTEALGGSSALFTKIADLEATLTEGTYTFDVSFYNGLVLDTSDWTAFGGDFTVTWR